MAAELARRLDGPQAALRARIIAATFLASLRIAAQEWLEHPGRPLRDVLRDVLAHAAPAAG